MTARTMQPQGGKGMTRTSAGRTSTILAVLGLVSVASCGRTPTAPVKGCVWADTTITADGIRLIITRHSVKPCEKVAA